MTIELPTTLHDRYAQLASELDGFEDADDLARYVLEETATELGRSDGGGSDGGAGDSADDEVVEDRLEQLGYLEK